MSRPNLVLALLAVLGGLLIALVWVPLDSDTGLIYKARRQVRIGDAMAPTLAAGFIVLGGVLLLLQRLVDDSALSLRNLGFLAGFLGLFATATALMFWTGPSAVALFGPEDAAYRALRDTAPWKYLGFLLGGAVLIGGLIAAIEHRITLRTCLIALAAVVVLILLYDVPFDDLLLPPNGDY